jgi:transglutaminase-like putative cysteine protease
MADLRTIRRIRAPLAWTTAALVGGMLLHVDRVPFWVTAAALVCVGWRLAAEVRAIRLPSRIAKVGVAMILIAAVLMQFHTLNGLSAGTALLVVMGAIKLLETFAKRDRYVVIGSTMFLLLAACLDRQGLTRAPLYLLEAWICCTALAVVSQEGASLTNRAAGMLAARSLALAAPLAVLMFLFFPRMVGAFWTLPQADTAVTGLSDSMSPGSVSTLSESDDPAFRVRFDGAPPPPEERYWRGPVLHDFDGYTWQRGAGYYRQPVLQHEGIAYRYRVTMEPTSQRWWFALDTVSEYPARRAVLMFDHQLIGNETISRPTTFEAVSYTRNFTEGPPSTLARRYDTRLPPDRNPRSVQLAREMRADVASDADFVSAVLNMFRRGGFEYTLTPPKLDLDSVDDFVFNTKRGFCGHYASAFVTMMRAAGVPARVVTGYQGGQWNPVREYFLVRQSDAHAWAEVWLDGRGWTRIDPTAVVAPERLRRGVFDLLPDAMSEAQRFMRDSPWIADARMRWDAVNDWWNERVVRFDLATQMDLLKWLGFDAPDWQPLGWLFAAALVGWLMFVAWHVGKAFRATPMDRLARAYTRLCAKLAKAGAPRAPHEGPLAYADSVATQRPDLASKVRALLRRYADLRYGRSAAAASPEVAQFERDVARLRVPRESETPLRVQRAT